MPDELAPVIESEIEPENNENPATETEQSNDESVNPETESKEESPEVEAEQNPRKNIQARFDQLTKQKHAALKEAEYWKNKALESEGTKRDLAEHEFEKSQTLIETLNRDEWAAKVEAVSQEIPDYESVVSNSKAHVEPHVASAIFDSDLGPKLFHHFAKNPGELEQINGMTEKQAIKAIARLEIMLEKPKAPEIKTSSAPPPIRPLGSSVLPVSQKSPESMSAQEYMEWRKTQPWAN